MEFPKCEVCKEREFTLIIDGVKMCIYCYDLQRQNEPKPIDKVS